MFSTATKGESSIGTSVQCRLLVSSALHCGNCEKSGHLCGASFTLLCIGEAKVVLHLGVFLSFFAIPLIRFWGSQRDCSFVRCLGIVAGPRAPNAPIHDSSEKKKKPQKLCEIIKVFLFP